MTYKYCAVALRKDDEMLFTFVNLPSGIVAIGKGEDFRSAMEDTLMDLLEDEDFLPHDMLPPYRRPEEQEVEEIVTKVFALPYHKEDVDIVDVAVAD